MLVDTKLRDNISDMIAYEKHTGATDGGQDGKQQKLKDHFEELRERQRLAQREFHQKLFTELQKEVNFYKKEVFFPEIFLKYFLNKKVSSDGGTRKSAVAEALGTKFELPATNKQLSHSKSSGQVIRARTLVLGIITIQTIVS